MKLRTEQKKVQFKVTLMLSPTDHKLLETVTKVAANNDLEFDIERDLSSTLASAVRRAASDLGLSKSSSPTDAVSTSKFDTPSDGANSVR